MRSRGQLTVVILVLLMAAGMSWFFLRDVNPNPIYKPGDAIDSLDGVKVYFNGPTKEVYGDNYAEDGYFIGLKYQCVEFTNRYYYEHYHFKMKDSHGNANEFFNKDIQDGRVNEERGLLQFKNPSKVSPQIGDLIVFDKHTLGPYGHVAIVSEVTEHYVEIIQQNAGPFAFTRMRIPLIRKNHLYLERKRRIVGWLRMKGY